MHISSWPVAREMFKRGETCRKHSLYFLIRHLNAGLSWQGEKWSAVCFLLPLQDRCFQSFTFLPCDSPLLSFFFPVYLLLVPGYCSFQHEIVLLSPFLSPRIYGSHSRHNHLSLSAASIVYPSLISLAVLLRCAFDSRPARRIALLHLTLVFFSVPVKPLQILGPRCRRDTRNPASAFGDKSAKQIGEHLLIFR